MFPLFYFQESISKCIAQIEELFSSSLANIHQMAFNTNTKRPGTHTTNKTSNGLQADDVSQPETPTDVQDIYF